MVPPMTVLLEPADEVAVKERISAELERVRDRSKTLTVLSLPEPELLTQHSPLMSPLVWDYAHVGNYEEQWLVRSAAGKAALRPELDNIYDAFEHPRATRPTLPLLQPGEASGYLETVRRQVLASLDEIHLGGGHPLLGNGFVYGMVIQHEHQHDETMLATHQLRHGEPVLFAAGPPAAPPDRLPAEVFVPAGRFPMGTSTDAWAYDNERPEHSVDLPAFWIDTTPVTNAAYLSFIEAGGYREPRWWSPAGWEWRTRIEATAPGFWRREAGQWLRRRFGRDEPVPTDEPVQHVCWYEADAYARWAGRRLPTEAEWEKAASFDPRSQVKHRYPWGEEPPDEGRANLGQHYLQPAPAGSYPRGASPCGVRQMLGDVWEWTATDFSGYPGFRSFPYREYSEVFFGESYKVLRGGSWATDPVACRTTFRNWDFPIRRQIFAGFRCARDARPGDTG